VSVYLDTSVLASLFIDTDVFASRAKTFFLQADDVLIVSDFAAAEFASVLARLTRMNQIQESRTRAIFDAFDIWRARFADEEEAVPSDLLAATTIIRRLDLNLRAPDAINLAIALRLAASVATFDRRMAHNAQALGITVAAA
jgi:predicted nucleic acid-binding protein